MSKMIIRKIVICVFFFQIVNVFSQDVSLPKGFEIKFNYCSNELNTVNNSFTKKMSSGDSIVIKIRLTKKDKKKIYLLLDSTDFFSYPSHYKSSFDENEGFTTVTPCCSYNLIVYQKNSSKTVFWSQCERFNPNDDGFNKLMSIYEEILKIIQKKKQYKKLSQDRIERL